MGRPELFTFCQKNFPVFTRRNIGSDRRRVDCVRNPFRSLVYIYVSKLILIDTYKDRKPENFSDKRNRIAHPRFNRGLRPLSHPVRHRTGPQRLTEGSHRRATPLSAPHPPPARQESPRAFLWSLSATCRPVASGGPVRSGSAPASRLRFPAPPVSPDRRFARAFPRCRSP